MDKQPVDSRMIQYGKQTESNFKFYSRAWNEFKSDVRNRLNDNEGVTLSDGSGILLETTEYNRKDANLILKWIRDNYGAEAAAEASEYAIKVGKRRNVKLW